MTFLVVMCVFFELAFPVYVQPPRKIYTGTQWTLSALQRAARVYKQDNGEWPLDTQNSTFIYKLMGGKKQRPYIQYSGDKNVFAICQVYRMTSPKHSPWAGSEHGPVGREPFYLPRSSIQWPKEHGVEVTAYGGWGDFWTDNWDTVPDDPKICPWLSEDVVGFDELGGRYRCKLGISGYTVYTEGANHRDDRGRGDDIGATTSLWMVAAYHRGHFVLLVMLSGGGVYAYYRLVVRRLWL